MNKSILSMVNTPSDLKKLSLPELSLLSEEIRTFLIDNVSKTGGHLAPNLGVVELTIALHYVFDSPKDAFIWDVGHQSYVHKILTGRKDKFPTLRKKNGMSGYPSPAESEHDIVHAGHSSTSVSLGVGIATAKKINADESATVAIIGDGSFTSGMVYEALNDASWREVPLLIILNDNKMSISENVGGIAKHLNILRTNKMYLSLKREVSGVLSHNLVGRWIHEMLFAIKLSIKKRFFSRQNIFENLGVRYLGPFDGHNLSQLITLFEEVKNHKTTLLLHILTQKGRGSEDALKDPINYHGVSAKDDSIPLNPKKGKSWSNVFGDAVCALAEKDKDIVVLTAAMREGTGLLNYSKKFSNRFIDVGIAEQHAVTCATGLAIQGKKPIVAIYSTFLQRAFDQVLHDVAIAEYPVIFCLDRSGLVPGDGKTHQGVFDIAYLRVIPKMIIMSPLTEFELQLMLQQALIWKKPVVIRYPKDIAPIWDQAPKDLILGQGVELVEGDDGVIVIFGSLLEEALMTQTLLKSHHKNYAIYHLRFAKPINDTVIDYLNTKKNIVLLEEGVAIGGIGEYLQNKIDKNTSLLIKNIGDQFPSTDTREGLLLDFGFEAKSLVQEILNNLH